MLVLSRKDGERVVIDGGIVVTVVEVRDGKVRLGFDAPPDVKIMREELTGGGRPLPPKPPKPRPGRGGWRP